MLEELGLILDPMRRELRPMPMSLMPRFAIAIGTGATPLTIASPAR